MKKTILFILSFLILSTSSIYAQTQPLLPLSAKGVAVYGWKDGVQTPIYLKNEHTLYPIASLTKLITAKVAEDLYKPEDIFTMSKSAVATHGITNGVYIGSQFSRDDLLKALLVNSSNDAAEALAEKAGKSIFLKKMNDVLHTNKYTVTDFINPSGLDPIKKGLKTNRMTPYHMTRLLNDIYKTDPLLAKIMGSDMTEINDLKNNKLSILKQTNALYRDENYKDKVLMSKTGLTNLAGQNLAFITEGTNEYDYISIVFLGSKSRLTDSKKILDWLSSQQFGG